MFQWTDWAFTRPDEGDPARPAGPAGWPMWMDRRHAEFLYGLAVSGVYKDVAEIGCYKGSTSAALVQAQIDGGGFALSLVDPWAAPELDAVAGRSPGPCWVIRRRGVEFLRPGLDLVVIDGDHSAGAVGAELFAALAAGVETLVFHDVTVGVFSGFEGPQIAAELLRDTGRWFVLEDFLPRAGEFTERGLLFATKVPGRGRAVRPLWDDMLARVYG